MYKQLEQTTTQQEKSKALDQISKALEKRQTEKTINRLIHSNIKQNSFISVLSNYKVNHELIYKAFNEVENNTIETLNENPKQKLKAENKKHHKTIEVYAYNIIKYMAVTQLTRDFLKEIKEVEKELLSVDKSNRYYYEWNKQELKQQHQKLLSRFNKAIAQQETLLITKKHRYTNQYKELINSDLCIYSKHRDSNNKTNYNMVFSNQEIKKLNKAIDKSINLSSHYIKHIKVKPSEANNKKRILEKKQKHFIKTVFLKKFLRMNKGYFWNIDLMRDTLKAFKMQYSKEYLSDLLENTMGYSLYRGLGYNTVANNKRFTDHKISRVSIFGKPIIEKTKHSIDFKEYIRSFSNKDLLLECSFKMGC